MNTPISTLLEQKGGVVHSVNATATVAEAVQEMVRNRVGAVLVMDGAKVAGIFTERDVLRRVVGQELEPKTTPVTRVMTADVLVAGPTATVQQMMELFTEKRCRHMPVVQDGKLLGMISIGDVSRWVANTHRAEAESLRQYITGGLSG
jgi:CBS domain-containing protein